MTKAGFGSFQFGFDDAYVELQEAPNLLRRGYFDTGAAEEKILRQHQFLVLGYKGAGKSMVSARFQLLAKDSPTYYAASQPVTIREMALKDFRGIIPNSFDAPARALWSWVLFLFVRAVEQIERDGQATAESRATVGEAIGILRDHQIVSSSPKSLQKLKTAKVEAQKPPVKFTDQTWQLDQRMPDQSVHVWLKYLEAVCSSFRSQRFHVIFVDGLDDLGPINEGNATLIGGLIQAAAYVNRVLRAEEAPIKVAVCCRTDLFERLDLPTKGKLRSDFGVELNWYQDPRRAEKSNLVGLANQRARMHQPGLGSIFEGQFFPTRIDNQQAARFLSMNTRHTPRDFLALLRNIQEFANGSGKLDRDAILSGARQYSQVYFVGEMDDALDSYFSGPQKQIVRQALGKIRSKTFDRVRFARAIDAAAIKARVDPDEALEALFECSFIGSGSLTESGEKYYRFRHRNPTVSAADQDSFELHPGLWKAYNLA
jgi:hypothetical protein